MKSSSLKTSLISSVLLLALVVSDGTSLGALASPQRQPRPHEPAHEQPHRSPPPHEPAHEQPHRSPPPHEPAHEQHHRSPPPHEPAHEQLHRLPPPQPIDGNYIESDENLLSPLGEITIDHETGAKLPEEANDGELEGGDHHTGWTYNDQTGWAVEYPECVGKKLRQSPIDIITTDVIFNSRMKLEFVDYDQDVEFEYKNTHHSVSLTPIPAFSPPAIRVNWVHNGTPDEYELQEIHFHWGHGKEKGSEHEINDQKAAAEMHMVHYRKGLKKEDIGSVDNSVVVIGVFIESDAVEHNKLETLVKRAENVNGTDAEYRASSPDNLIHLLPENHHSFYTYNGSLTTPPCYEVVTWILMSEPVYMCQDQLEKLSNLEVAKPGVGRQKIQSNHRDIQPLLLRPVYASFNTTESITYSPTRIGKRIGMPHQNLGERLSDELNRFWKKVNNVKVTVKRAYGSINRARRDLLDTIRKEGGGGRAVGDDIAPAGETSGDSSAVSS